LRHLVKSEEILGAQIASVHNLTFYLWLVSQARTQLMEGTFGDWKKQILKKISQRL
jgi:queuine tRNA-ribosyltransferase